MPTLIVRDHRKSDDGFRLLLQDADAPGSNRRPLATCWPVSPDTSPAEFAATISHLIFPKPDRIVIQDWSQDRKLQSAIKYLLVNHSLVLESKTSFDQPCVDTGSDRS